MTGLTITADFVDKALHLQDTNDYSALTPPAGATEIGINFRLVSPAGNTIYNNTSSTDLDMYPDQADEFDIPFQLDSGSNIVQGTYQLRRSRFWVDSSGDIVEAIDVTDYVVPVNFPSPQGSLQVEIDYFAPLLKSTDTTNYVAGGVTPNIIRDNRIIHSNAIAPPLSPVVSSGPVVQTNVFYGEEGGLEYVFQLTSDLEYEYAGVVTATGGLQVAGTPIVGYPTSPVNQSLFVHEQISAQEKKDIEQPAFICKVFCVLKALYERFEKSRCSNAKIANENLYPFLAASAIAQLMRNAYLCGKTGLVSQYKDAIFSLGKAGDDCGCCEGEGPQPVQGLGGITGQTVVQGVVGQITVSFDGTGTYIVGLADNVLEILNNLGIAIESPNGSLNISSSVVNGITTFTIEVASEFDVNRLDTIVRMGFNPSGLPNYTILQQALTGSVFDEVSQSGSPFLATPSEVTNAAEWQSRPVVIEVRNFFSGGTEEYFPSVEGVGGKGGLDITVNDSITPEVFYFDPASDFVLVRLKHDDGSLVTGGYMIDRAVGEIKMKITLTA